MKNLKFLPTMLSILFVLVCFHVSVSGQSDDRNKLATISASGSGVRWDVAAPYSSLTMTVSTPDGQVYRKEFKAGSSPEFQLYDKEGNRMPDGQYKYELRLTPEISAEVKKALKEARAKNTADDAAPEREMRKRGLLPSQSLVQSGGFQVVRGSVIVAGAVEPGARRIGKTTVRPMPARPFAQSEDVSMQQATFVLDRGVEAAALRAYGKMAGQPFAHAAFPDQVIPDDLIVQGSLCVGFDCVNNESFGFDTIRLKENNTRIKFEDTSVGSFPTNDWQLTANDSASGGLSKFSIEDITGAKVPFTVEAGAATNSIYVDSTGRMGLRTSTPVLDVHANTSNTPGIRLEQNSSGGFTAQTWDVSGNEANFFIRDVTGGSRLPFRIRPGAPTSSIDINNAGNVGIGTASPGHHLHVLGTGIQTIAVQSTQNGNNAQIAFIGLTAGGTAQQWQLGENLATTGGNFELFDSTAGAARILVNTSGNVGIGTTSPTQKLHVAGNILVTGGSFIDDGTTLNAPDYVFESDYRLMSLDELRAFIARKKHLPNMPSAAEVRKNGINLSQYQMKLLEKIEELTLHVLAEQKQRLEQQKEIEQLKAQVQQLQSATRKRRK
jgi:hypothetical protein